MFEKLKQWYTKYHTDFPQINVDELISGFDEKTQDGVKKWIKDNQISFSALNKNRYYDALNFGMHLRDIYGHAAEDGKSFSVVDNQPVGNPKTLARLSAEEYEKLPAKFKGSYEYNEKFGDYQPRGNVRTNRLSGTIVLKYGKGQKKEEILDLIDSVYKQHRSGDLKGLYATLSKLGKVTRVEDITDKARDPQQSGIAKLSKEIYDEKLREGRIVATSEKLREVREYAKQSAASLAKDQDARQEQLEANHRAEREELLRRQQAEKAEMKKTIAAEKESNKEMWKEASTLITEQYRRTYNGK